jgi:hypothetical protein
MSVLELLSVLAMIALIAVRLVVAITGLWHHGPAMETAPLFHSGRSSVAPLPINVSWQTL